MIEFIAAAAFWFLAWLVVLARWKTGRIESDRAALLMSTISTGSLGIYSLARQQLDPVLVLVLIVGASVQFLFTRYMLRVFAVDRPRAG